MKLYPTERPSALPAGRALVLGTGVAHADAVGQLAVPGATGTSRLAAQIVGRPWYGSVQLNQLNGAQVQQLRTGGSMVTVIGMVKSPFVEGVDASGVPPRGRPVETRPRLTSRPRNPYTGIRGLSHFHQWGTCTPARERKRGDRDDFGAGATRHDCRDECRPAMPPVRPRPLVLRLPGRARTGQVAVRRLPGPDRVPGRCRRAVGALGRLGWRDLRAWHRGSAEAAAGSSAQGGRRPGRDPAGADGDPGRRGHLGGLT